MAKPMTTKAFTCERNERQSKHRFAAKSDTEQPAAPSCSQLARNYMTLMPVLLTFALGATESMRVRVDTPFYTASSVVAALIWRARLGSTARRRQKLRFACLAFTRLVILLHSALLRLSPVDVLQFISLDSTWCLENTHSSSRSRSCHLFV